MKYLINFKNYPQAIGKNAIELARKLEKAAEEANEEVILVVPPVELAKVCESVSLQVFSQHIDPFAPGAFTGAVLAESVAEAGAVGTLINHSERRIGPENIPLAVERAHENELITVVCVPDKELLNFIAEFRPDYIAFEPPELIGTGRSVSKYKAEEIELVRKIIAGRSELIVGAGVSTREDVVLAEKLGAVGVLVASAVVKAKEPGKALLRLMGYES